MKAIGPQRSYIHKVTRDRGTNEQMNERTYKVKNYRYMLPYYRMQGINMSAVTKVDNTEFKMPSFLQFIKYYQPMKYLHDKLT
jgi:hypothetical protein